MGSRKNDEVLSQSSSTKYSYRTRDSDRFLIQNFHLTEADNSIDSLLSNPIKSGYLLSYCKSQFSAENMIYLLNIDSFKDKLEDTKAWNEDLNYRLIDQSIEGFTTIRAESPSFSLTVGGENSWPSEKITFEKYFHDVKFIWDTYLSSNSKHQICVPARVLSNTIHRIENLNLYGPTVFDETMLDPIKTMRADVLPRFLVSSHFNKMQSRLNDLYPLPQPGELTLKLPSNSMTLDWPDENVTIENLRALTMEELFHERIVYAEFLQYSKKIFADENALFARGMSIFKCHWKHATCKGCPSEAENMAWKLFRYFICPGSPFEISMSRWRCKELMLALADPTVDMFQGLERSCHKLIRDMYSAYTFTKEFQIVLETIRKKKKERLKEIQLESSISHAKHSTCFPWANKNAT